ncbi:hypothetical protein ABT294_48700 [Nonomuraea sp. NPDC000554]|uniref:hypothetical protein n=1 Tax=Nonomuraea sp. NPDC000554 TaxID=3154259 RepID=UPI00331A723B
MNGQAGVNVGHENLLLGEDGISTTTGGLLIDQASGPACHQPADRVHQDPEDRPLPHPASNTEEFALHARALLADNPGTVIVPGDVCDPAAVLGHSTVQDHLGAAGDLALHFRRRGGGPDRRRVLASGSHVIISPGHPAS